MSSLTFFRIHRPSLSPGPRKLRIDVRFALSYEALKINGKFSERATPLITSAMNRACFSLSITHGPAIRKRSPDPMRTLSIWNEEVKIFHRRDAEDSEISLMSVIRSEARDL